MGESLIAVERRLAALENELKELRRDVSRLLPPTGSGHEALDRLPFVAPRPTTGESAEDTKKVLRDMGIEGEPIGAEALQNLMIAEGIDPNGNEFSRGIVEMREE